MKHEEELRQLLIENAICLIAKGGFEMATTRAIVSVRESTLGVRPNEAYIYRIFGSKENLYAAVFHHLDCEVCDAFYKGLAIIGNIDVKPKAKFEAFFLMAWRFLLNNEEHCRAYVRYYYSVYFKGESLESHNKLFWGMISVIKTLFKEEADVLALMHTVFITLLDFAIRVYNGNITDSDDNRKHVFNVLYCMLETYLKEDLLLGDI